MNRETYLMTIEEHYSKAWNSPCVRLFLNGTEDKFEEEVRILKYPPVEGRTHWTYATCGMSYTEEEEAMECFLYSPHEADEPLVGLLTMLVHYHQYKSRFGHGHTVDFGMPWLGDSLYDHGVMLTPYLDHEQFEYLSDDNHSIRFLWLLPITEAEREYKIRHGLDALERCFEESRLNYLDPSRESVK
jgi:hypothetical protein